MAQLLCHHAAQQAAPSPSAATAPCWSCGAVVTKSSFRRAGADEFTKPFSVVDEPQQASSSSCCAQKFRHQLQGLLRWLLKHPQPHRIPTQNSSQNYHAVWAVSEREFPGSFQAKPPLACLSCGCSTFHLSRSQPPIAVCSEPFLQ
jgi:hypothetical protein